jgi:hypothetical protein
MNDFFSIQPYRIHVGADVTASAANAAESTPASVVVTPTALYVSLGALVLIVGIFAVGTLVPAHSN